MRYTKFSTAIVAIVLAMGAPDRTCAQDAPAQVGVEGRWEAQLGGSGLRLLLELTQTRDSLLFGSLTSVDQGGARLPIDRITATGDSLHFEIRSARVTFAGALSADGTRLAGMWTQGGSVPLELTRTAVATVAEVEPEATSLFGVPAGVVVPVPPTSFAGAGGQHLAYELHITNHSRAPMLLTRLAIYDDTTTLAQWEGAALHAIVAQRRPDVTDNRDIPAGGWAIVHVWVTLDGAARVPSTLRHVLTVDGRTLEGAVDVADAGPVVLGPPLRGGDWLAANGPSNASGHRRALVPIDGDAYIAQRFAIDWARIGANGRLFDGDPADNASYHGYGAEVLAVADAVVASVMDGIPENTAGSTPLRSAAAGDTLRGVSITLESVGGNYVVLDLGQGKYAFYGHLLPGSLRVQAGDRVRRGQVIGLLGNSGNSTGPHLHFHVSDSNNPLAAEGVPYVIDGWELMRGPGTWERRTNELPMQNERVRFPGN